MVDSDPAQIVDWLLTHFAARRRERGLTLQELAERSGVDRSYVGLLEKGQRRPTLEVALRLSKALDGRLVDLLQEAERALNKSKKDSKKSSARRSSN